MTEYILPFDIKCSIMKNMSYIHIYKLTLEGDKDIMQFLLNEGNRFITKLQEYISPDSDYSELSENIDYSDLNEIQRVLWNMIICVDPIDDNSNDSGIINLIYDVCWFLTMETEKPESFSGMYADIWERIIVEYLDSEYDSNTAAYGGYKGWKYIFRAIEKYPKEHDLETLGKQKYCLALLITTYLEQKDTIMTMYSHEYNKIDTNQKYYDELRCLICTVSRNGHLEIGMIDSQFVKETFNFIDIFT